MTEGFIFDAGWVFFAAWGMVLAAIGVITFGRDALTITPRETSRKTSTHKSGD
jgi:hypothetical protein